MATLLSPLARPDVRRVYQAGDATELVLERRDSFSLWGELTPVPHFALAPDVRRLIRLAVSNAKRARLRDWIAEDEERAPVTLSRVTFEQEERIRRLREYDGLSYSAIAEIVFGDRFRDQVVRAVVLKLREAGHDV